MTSSSTTGPSLSSCCGAPIKAHYADEGTGCYLCEKCGKACDPAPSAETIEDGFGSSWDKRCPSCGADMEVVRPGKVQCSAACEMKDGILSDEEAHFLAYSGKNPSALMSDRAARKDREEALEAKLKIAREALEEANGAICSEFCSRDGEHHWRCDPSREALSKLRTP